MKLYSSYQHASVSMSSDVQFLEGVHRIFKEFPVKHVIESGTYKGTGSTRALAEALIATQRQASLKSFHTLEVDYDLYRQAKANLLPYPFVTPVWGMSVNKKEALDFVRNDTVLLDHEKVSNVFIDDVTNPVAFYTNEINGHLSDLEEKPPAKKVIDWNHLFSRFRENYFATKIPKIKKELPLFLLDSAGGIGWLEFQKMVSLMGNHEYLLILDDIHHLKHFRSFAHLQTDNRFTIRSSNMQQGWVLAHFRP